MQMFHQIQLENKQSLLYHEALTPDNNNLSSLIAMSVLYPFRVLSETREGQIEEDCCCCGLNDYFFVEVKTKIYW